MNFKHIVTLSLILLVGYLGYTIQTQKGAYVVNFKPITQSQNPVDSRTEIADFVKIYSDFFQSQFDSLQF